jgi:hypothetical protein
LFVGAGFGLVLGYIGVRVAFRLPVGEPRNLFCLGLAYLAYLVGAMPGASGVLVGRWLAPVPGEVVQSLPQALLRKEGKVFLLLLGTLLLWPQQEAVLAPGSLAVALLAALVAVLILRIVLYPLFGLIGIELQPPDASTAENGEIPR